jgi:assimilatory nitrate reductase catalytic subunit
MNHDPVTSKAASASTASSASPARVALAARLRDWLWQDQGRLTDRLELAPAPFQLGRLPLARQPDELVTSVCGYCSTGCGLSIHLRDGQAVGLSPRHEHPVNLGMACPKGWEALTVLRSADRATRPLVRNRRGRMVPTDWDAALRTFCERFKDIQRRYGPHSVAFLSTGQIATEEMALLGSVAKFGMGLLHGDGNTRQCMATAVVAYKEAFGFDAPPYTYQDLEESDVIVLVGSNLCIAHPILWQRILRNRRRPRIIVIDPRKTETAMAATDHLALRPKSDLVLLYGLANLLVGRGWIDRAFIDAHTTGYEALARHVAEFPPERVARESGIDEPTLERIAAAIGGSKRVSLWWTMGVNQSYQGVRTAQAIINLALLTGNIGRPGTGANSITGQCNAMGSRLFSNTTNLLGGHDFAREEHRRKVAHVLGIDPGRIPTSAGWAYPEIIEGILAGKIRGLWVVATNPAHSWINQNMLSDVLGRLEFLVVQDMYHTTETARRADLVLPAAGWGEKEGTFINSERRIGRIRKVTHPPGEAMTDLAIFRLVAHYWGCGEMFRGWTDPQSVFHILKKLSRGQPCDFSGIRDYAMLDACDGIQWPLAYAPSPDGAPASPEGAPLPRDRAPPPPEPQRRLFSDGRFFHPDGRARMVVEAPREMPEPPSENFPLLLLTGRGTAAQWHTETRTSKSSILRQLAPRELHLEIHPDDARRFGIRPSQLVVVESQRGRIQARAFVTRSVAPGQVFLPMHDPQTNQLTHAHFDPYSRQPSYKNCAVRVRPASANP